ncbi:hypothetical protein LIER_26192 [Lithospermum erythrorhizon]|uniref:Uncharacterized protein n=1 Tax=Lithospermum erythrorhizon TaxID=34254 RepID=A0AAV3RAP2_LITER
MGSEFDSDRFIENSDLGMAELELDTFETPIFVTSVFGNISGHINSDAGVDSIEEANDPMKSNASITWDHMVNVTLPRGKRKQKSKRRNRLLSFQTGGTIVASIRRDTIEVLLCDGDWIKEAYGIRSAKEKNDDPIELEFEKEFDMEDTKSTVVVDRPAPTQVSQPVQGIHITL